MPSFYEPTEKRIYSESIVLPKDEDVGWRPLFAGRVREDLSPLTQVRMCNMARYLYLTNPLAHAIIDLRTAFIVGGGIKFSAADPKVQQLVDRFWEDPVNAWTSRFSSRVRELFLYGELFLGTEVNKVTGFVRVNFINPLDVVRVVINPQNVELLEEIELTPTVVRPGHSSLLKVVNYNDKTGLLEGDVFVFAVNKSSDSPRGTSDLLSQIDWLGLYDQLLFNSLERTTHMNAWYWDVTLEGYNEEQIIDWLNKIQGTSLKPGSIRAHNEKVKWDVVNPSLAAAEISEAARMFKLQIISGSGLMESFFGQGIPGGRTQLSESQEATFKLLQDRQQYVKYMISFLFRYVIDQAIKHKMLPNDVDKTVRVLMPKISVRDLQRGGGAMFRFTQSLDLAKKNGWITDEQAKQVLEALLSQLGFGAELEVHGEEDGSDEAVLI